MQAKHLTTFLKGNIPLAIGKYHHFLYKYVIPSFFFLAKKSIPYSCASSNKERSMKKQKHSIRIKVNYSFYLAISSLTSRISQPLPHPPSPPPPFPPWHSLLTSKGTNKAWTIIIIISVRRLILILWRESSHAPSYESPPPPPPTPSNIRERKQRWFWATHVNRKWTFHIPERWFCPNFQSILSKKRSPI